jgi:hypothetical protein
VLRERIPAVHHARYDVLGLAQPVQLADGRLSARIFVTCRQALRDFMATENNPYEKSIKALLASEETNLDISREMYWELKREYADSAKKLTRWAFWGILLICIFELLNHRLISNASVSFIQVTRLNFLLYLLPPSVTFALVNVLYFAIEQFTYGSLMKELAKQRFPGIYSSGIAALFVSKSGILASEIPRSLMTRRAYRDSNIYWGIQAWAASFTYIGFEVYAYIQLFRHFGASSIAVWLSLCLSGFLTVLALLFTIDGFAMAAFAESD